MRAFCVVFLVSLFCYFYHKDENLMRKTFAKIEFRMCYVFLVQSTIHNLIQRIQVKVKCYCLIYIAQLLESIIQYGRNIKCRHKSCLTKLTRLGHLYQIKSPIWPELLIISTILHVLIVIQITRKLIYCKNCTLTNSIFRIDSCSTNLIYVPPYIRGCVYNFLRLRNYSYCIFSRIHEF